MSVYDALAPSFDRDRAFPGDVAEAIRAAVLAAVAADRPRLLDLGAGSGRTGWAFAAAGDDYVGADLSFGMLQAFQRRARGGGAPALRLVQADGARLPFPDATFDAVMLIQIFGGLRDWRRLVAEARRVVRASGALITGRTIAPSDGVDARMKQRLAELLVEMGVRADEANARDDVELWLKTNAASATRAIAAAWEADRSPGGFLDRHRTGARFSALPAPVKDEAMRRLGEWAAQTFGTLDRALSERHEFELRVFRFQEGTGR